MRLIDADKLRAQFPEPADWKDGNNALVHITGIWAEIDTAETVEAIPLTYLTSRISRLRQHKTYAGDFGADLIEAIIKDYNKEKDT